MQTHRRTPCRKRINALTCNTRNIIFVNTTYQIQNIVKKYSSTLRMRLNFVTQCRVILTFNIFNTKLYSIYHILSMFEKLIIKNVKGEISCRGLRLVLEVRKSYYDNTITDQFNRSSQKQFECKHLRM